MYFSIWYGKDKASKPKLRPCRVQTMNTGIEKHIAKIATMFTLLLVLCGVGVGIAASAKKDEIISSCATRLALAVDALQTYSEYSAERPETGTVKAALHHAVYAAEVSHEKAELSRDFISVNGHFRLEDIDQHALFAGKASQEQVCQVDQGKVVIWEKEKKTRTARKMLISLVVNDGYMKEFVREVIDKAIVKSDCVDTYNRANALRRVILHLIEYASAWNNKVHAEEVKWLESCQTVEAIEEQSRASHAVDETFQWDTGKAFRVWYRFNHYSPGSWNSDSDAKPLDRKASLRFAETFLFRRFHVDEMEKDDALKILRAIDGELLRIIAEHTHVHDK